MDASDVQMSVAQWLGVIFTGLGLLAVFGQLRNAIASLARNTPKIVQRQLGEYHQCVSKDLVMMDSESAEHSLPTLKGWTQHCYLNNKALRICMDQVHTKQRGRPGTSCWTQLLTRCGISPSDLIAHGGSKAVMFPATRKVHPQPQSVDQADLQNIDGRLHYGFSPAEFLVLLIVGGFATEAFRNIETSGPSTEKGFVGTLRLAKHSPFMQRAYFDPWDGIRKLNHETSRSVHNLPLRAALDLTQD